MNVETLGLHCAAQYRWAREVKTSPIFRVIDFIVAH
jgi:hypothetical protein